MTLDWAPREHNREADALTNEDFRCLAEDKRMRVDIAKVEFLVLREMMEAGAAFEEERSQAKSREAAQPGSPQG